MLQKTFKLDPSQTITAFGALAEQGKAGQYELRDLATQAERFTAASTSWGRTGLGGLREMGAFAQIARGMISSADEVSTAQRSVVLALQTNGKTPASTSRST